VLLHIISFIFLFIREPNAIKSQLQDMTHEWEVNRNSCERKFSKFGDNNHPTFFPKGVGILMRSPRCLHVCARAWLSHIWTCGSIYGILLNHIHTLWHTPTSQSRVFRFPIMRIIKSADVRNSEVGVLLALRTCLLFWGPEIRLNSC